MEKMMEEENIIKNEMKGHGNNRKRNRARKCGNMYFYIKNGKFHFPGYNAV
jgi:hypothetical protein